MREEKEGNGEEPEEAEEKNKVKRGERMQCLVNEGKRSSKESEWGPTKVIQKLVWR